jgi:hypothetical protein
MTFSIVSPIQNGDPGNGPVNPVNGTNPVTYTFPHAQTQGNCNLVALSWASTVITLNSIVDSSGNQYKTLVSLSDQSQMVSICVALNIAAASANTNTITATFSSGPNFAELFPVEIQGPTAIDYAACTAASGTSGLVLSAGPVSCRYFSEILFGYGVGVSSGLSSPGTGWSYVNWGNGGTLTGNGNILEWQTTSGGGTFTATSNQGTSQGWTQAIVGLGAGNLAISPTDAVFFGIT